MRIMRSSSEIVLGTYPKDFLDGELSTLNLQKDDRKSVLGNRGHCQQS